MPGDVEQLELTFDPSTAVTALAWSPVAEPGAVAVVYDVIRSSEAEDFSLATCVESGDGSDLVAEDPTVPQRNQIHFFLVRAANACPAGDGSLGAGINGLARSAKACP
ncbi:MAG: hypothetical protein GWN45_02535 [Gammaproteobacteria bacterium]|nr:hypothetical protein [Gammaproteobacteria bacterium]